MLAQGSNDRLFVLAGLLESGRKSTVGREIREEACLYLVMLSTSSLQPWNTKDKATTALLGPSRAVAIHMPRELR
ncbi:hypothetical protein KC325_g300 [Hortaea werneckii]|nr:hypothetical protein KC325_g300 [Hortaea werneckii]